MTHLFGFTERGYLVWSTASGNCGGTDSDFSYFGAGMNGFTEVSPGFDTTVFTQRTFAATPGSTVTLYLNSVMLSGAATPDMVGDDYVIVEFQVTTP